MPPRSPLPRRHGLDACWVRTPDRVPGQPAPHPTIEAFLRTRLPEQAPVTELLASGGFVDEHGHPWTTADPYRPSTLIWFHRPLLPEPEVPGMLEILHQDERILVVDKPPFLATTPRGSHVRESVIAKLRTRLDLPDLAPAHRLDRLTAGVLLLTVQRRWRASYAGVFAAGAVTKTYEALAPRLADGGGWPRVLTGRIVKERGSLQARLVPGVPNAVTELTLIEIRGDLARYELRPSTGKTHQLRVQLNALGAPIVGDPLYPVVRDVAPADFSEPLRLVARRLEFTDPIDGTRRVFTSRAALRWPE